MASLDYIAGFFDGEGCITVTKALLPSGSYRYRGVIMLSNSNKDVLKDIQTSLLYYAVHSHLIVSKPRNLKHKWKWRLSVSSNADQFRMLALIGPLLFVKKTQAVLLTRYLAIPGQNPEARESIRNAMRDLNKRGQ